jgi:starch phosphorylase
MNGAVPIPPQLARLTDLADNLWWSWHPQARSLFKQISYPLWRATAHNPVRMLQLVSPERLEALAHDPDFAAEYERVLAAFDAEMGDGHLWFCHQYPDVGAQPAPVGNGETGLAYFSAEFGIHGSLPIYSGGLGVLSGDHCKEANDLGLPLVGVGFVYPQGYFRQRITPTGMQEAIYDTLNLDWVPLHPVLGPDGQRIKVHVVLRGQPVTVQVWQVRVGRVHLYLMDANVPENPPWERDLTARLYGGDQETRIRQEMVLGLGGVRVLRALDIWPRAWHLNEGHSAFLVLERLREAIQTGQTFDEALAKVRATTVFTTHTPVPAGHDAFSYHLMDEYFGRFWQEMGISREQFMNLGEYDGRFNMTVLGLRLSGKTNGVSQLHGQVSRRMWQSVWPDRPVEQVPIGAITNGVHVPSWISSELKSLYGRYLGPDWLDNHDGPALWEAVLEIPDAELWEVHRLLRAKLLAFVDARVRQRWMAGQMDAGQVLGSGTLLDPDALTIGFARRFATYKRATLIFRDLERLKRILHTPQRPVQIVFAGKAHPADGGGKELIQQVVHYAQDSSLGGRVAFLEDYDMHMARFLVQGVDVWLNSPRRPNEASGTSGMKAAMNGVPNLSVLDGWWPEGYNGANGWVIGEGQEDWDWNIQDERDAQSLYAILEQQVVPLFYERDAHGVPRRWVHVMKEAIRSSVAAFSSRRMLKEYAEQLYVPALRHPM